METFLDRQIVLTFTVISFTQKKVLRSYLIWGIFILFSLFNVLVFLFSSGVGQIGSKILELLKLKAFIDCINHYDLSSHNYNVQSM